MTEKEIHLGKQAAGVAGAQLVEDGMIVGLGTGSTAAYAIDELGRRVREEGLKIQGTPTSFAAEQLALKNEIPLTSLDHVRHIDLALDGADEVAPDFSLIKGRGAAHTREKVVAALAKRFIVLVDETKMVDRLTSKMPIPVELLPMALRPVMTKLRSFGATPELRLGANKDGPVVSDQGMWILDAHFEAEIDPRELNILIKSLPGVLDHGLFIDLATDVYLGLDNGELKIIEKA